MEAKNEALQQKMACPIYHMFASISPVCIHRCPDVLGMRRRVGPKSRHRLELRHRPKLRHRLEPRHRLELRHRPELRHRLEPRHRLELRHGPNSGTGPAATSSTSSPDTEAIRAAIAGGSTTAPPSAPAPGGITITGIHNGPPTIGIKSNSPHVMRWSRAGSAPVPAATRLYDGYRLTRSSGELKRTPLERGFVFTTPDEVEETIWVWTDILSPSYRDFAEVYELNRDTDSDTKNDALDIASEHLGLISHIARDPSDMREGDETSVNPVNRGILGQVREFQSGHQISARFDDAYGIYICIAATCRIDMTGSAPQRLLAVTGWAFMPKDYTGAGGGSRSPQVLVHDTNYRYFGLWLRGPDDDNEGRFDIQTFAGGSEPFSGDVTALTGRATYIGPAGGQYVKDTGDGSAVTGLFTAKVTLHADFGASPMIHGGMRDFRGGSRDLEWSLWFDETAITAQGTFDGKTSGSTYVGPGEGGGEAYSGGPGNIGTYGGKFYGNGDNGYPNGAVGTFTGKFNDGLVIGAFGGSREITNP